MNESTPDPRVIDLTARRQSKIEATSPHLSMFALCGCTEQGTPFVCACDWSEDDAMMVITALKCPECNAVVPVHQGIINGAGGVNG